MALTQSRSRSRGLGTFTSTLTTTRLDQLVDGGLARNAKRIVFYYATVVLLKAHDDVVIKTGRLLRSLSQGQPENIWSVENDGYRIRFGTIVYYAVYVEFGTRSMHARPFLTPAVEFYRGEWNRAIGGLFWTSGVQMQGL